MRKKLLLLHNKPLFARSWRVLRRNDSSKGKQLGLPSRTSSLIGTGHVDIFTFLLPFLFFSCVLSSNYCVFSRPVHKSILPKQVRKVI